MSDFFFFHKLRALCTNRIETVSHNTKLSGSSADENSETGHDLVTDDSQRANGSVKGTEGKQQ